MGLKEIAESGRRFTMEVEQLPSGNIRMDIPLENIKLNFADAKAFAKYVMEELDPK